MFSAERIPYQLTKAFTKIVAAYVDAAEELSPFYEQRPTIAGIEATLHKKKEQGVNREVLVKVLQDQYQRQDFKEAVKKNLDLLLSENTFTICTAHQPNLFTGPVYFVYKILHAIKLADQLCRDLPGYHFVPVYYMGSEDADFAELNHTWVQGKKLEWKKEQKGAVGRMVVDNTLVQLIDELEGQLAGEENGPEVISLLKKAYVNGKTIQQATFELLNELYGSYGLIVLIPDHVELKKLMLPVFEQDLFHHTSSGIVQKTSEALGEYFNVQAHPREINLFYLKENIRERIVRKDDLFFVHNTELQFSEKEMLDELQNYPERFSPNVILRGLFQETILPNLVFIGGGGELAYWLQLKDLFRHYKIVYPVLVIRNSFLIVEEKWKERISRIGLAVTEVFDPEDEIMKTIVSRHSERAVFLNGNMEKAEALYEELQKQAGAIDPTLLQHVQAIRARSIKNLQELEKKMLRAEKRKFAEQQGQVRKIREALFPGNSLQERMENFSFFYAKWGRGFIDELFKHSLTTGQEFTILTEEPEP